MLYDNPNLKPFYYAFLPDRITIAALKSLPLGFAYKVVDDMEEFDISKKCDIEWIMTNRETQKEISENCKKLFIRDLCISTTERVVEHAIVATTSSEFSSKVFKSTGVG